MLRAGLLREPLNVLEELNNRLCMCYQFWIYITVLNLGNFVNKFDKGALCCIMFAILIVIMSLKIVVHTST